MNDVTIVYFDLLINSLHNEDSNQDIIDDIQILRKKYINGVGKE